MSDYADLVESELGQIGSTLNDLTEYVGFERAISMQEYTSKEYVAEALEEFDEILDCYGEPSTPYYVCKDAHE